MKFNLPLCEGYEGRNHFRFEHDDFGLTHSKVIMIKSKTEHGMRGENWRPVSSSRFGFRHVAARTSRTRSAKERAPSFFIAAARWVSTVRWLIPRREAITLLA
jgi:hypothetical protein